MVWRVWGLRMFLGGLNKRLKKDFKKWQQLGVSLTPALCASCNAPVARACSGAGERRDPKASWQGHQPNTLPVPLLRSTQAGSGVWVFSVPWGIRRQARGRAWVNGGLASPHGEGGVMAEAWAARGPRGLWSPLWSIRTPPVRVINSTTSASGVLHQGAPGSLFHLCNCHYYFVLVRCHTSFHLLWVFKSLTHTTWNKKHLFLATVVRDFLSFSEQFFRKEIFPW